MRKAKRFHTSRWTRFIDRAGNHVLGQPNNGTGMNQQSYDERNGSLCHPGTWWEDQGGGRERSDL
jgi:hypothetical protein